jgi:dTDP-4-dehydrorhamnose reductase
VSAALAATSHHGVYHCTSQGETTWADFARLAAELVGAPADRVQGVAYADLKLKAPRPLHAVLDNRALREVGLDTLSTWQDALRAFVAAEAAG